MGEIDAIFSAEIIPGCITRYANIISSSISDLRHLKVCNHDRSNLQLTELLGCGLIKLYFKENLVVIITDVLVFISIRLMLFFFYLLFSVIQIQIIFFFLIFHFGV